MSNARSRVRGLLFLLTAEEAAEMGFIGLTGTIETRTIELARMNKSSMYKPSLNEEDRDLSDGRQEDVELFWMKFREACA